MPAKARYPISDFPVTDFRLPVSGYRFPSGKRFLFVSSEALPRAAKTRV